MTQNLLLNLDDDQPGSPNYYEQCYKQQLVEMGKIEDSEGPGAAIVFIMTTLLFTVNAYEQAEEGQVGATMTTLQNVQNEISSMQDDFNQVGQIQRQIQNDPDIQKQITADQNQIKQNNEQITTWQNQYNSDYATYNSDEIELAWMKDQNAPPEEIAKQQQKVNADLAKCNTDQQHITDLKNQNAELQDQINSLNGTTQENKLIEDAINNAVSIENQLAPLGISPESNPFSSISSSVIADINTIFGGNQISQNTALGGERTPDYNNDAAILTLWEKAWTPPSKGSGSGDKTKYNENTNLQPITDAFNGMQTSVSGLNSSAGTQLQYWQSDDQQTNSLIETLMQSFMQMLTTVIASFKST